MRKLSLKLYILILIIGEIMTVSSGILEGMSYEQLKPYIIAYSVIVIVFSIASMYIDKIVGMYIRYKIGE